MIYVFETEFVNAPISSVLTVKTVDTRNTINKMSILYIAINDNILIYNIFSSI